MPEFSDFLDLGSKTFLVTGASSGIGSAVVKLLDAAGAKVILTGRRKNQLEAIQKELSYPPNHMSLEMDLLNHSSFEEILESAVASLGKLDGMVLSGGGITFGPLQAWSSVTARKLFETNVFSTFELIRIFRKSAVSNSGSAVCILSSVVSRMSGAGLGLYAASKGSLSGLLSSVAIEYANSGRRINMVLPGFVRTPMLDQATDMFGGKRIDEVEARYPQGFAFPEEIANLICFLISQRSSVLNGSEIIADGGFSRL